MLNFTCVVDIFKRKEDTYLIPRMKEWALMTFPSQLKVTSASALFIWSSAILAIKVEVAMSILNEQWKENQQ